MRHEQLAPAVEDHGGRIYGEGREQLTPAADDRGSRIYDIQVTSAPGCGPTHTSLFSFSLHFLLDRGRLSIPNVLQLSYVAECRRRRLGASDC